MYMYACLLVCVCVCVCMYVCVLSSSATRHIDHTQTDPYLPLSHPSSSTNYSLTLLSWLRTCCPVRTSPLPAWEKASSVYYFWLTRIWSCGCYKWWEKILEDNDKRLSWYEADYKQVRNGIWMSVSEKQCEYEFEYEDGCVKKLVWGWVRNRIWGGWGWVWVLWCGYSMLHFIISHTTHFVLFFLIVIICLVHFSLFLSFTSPHSTSLTIPSFTVRTILTFLFSSILGVVCWWTVREVCAMLTITLLISSTRYSRRSTSRPLLWFFIYKRNRPFNFNCCDMIWLCMSLTSYFVFLNS
jgi:hypothetical protein